MLTVKQGIRLSAIIEKIGLKITDPKASEEQVGADLVMQFVSKAHVAEQEIYDFVAATKGITPEQAQEVDLIAFLKELFSDPGLASFFASAVKSKRRG